jgi:hypothetical protein
MTSRFSAWLTEKSFGMPVAGISGNFSPSGRRLGKQKNPTEREYSFAAMAI